MQGPPGVWKTRASARPDLPSDPDCVHPTVNRMGSSPATSSLRRTKLGFHKFGPRGEPLRSFPLSTEEREQLGRSSQEGHQQVPRPR